MLLINLKTIVKRKENNMLIMKFRKEEDAKHLLKKVKKMREEIEEVEDVLEECMEYEDADYRDDDYDDSADYRRMRRNERMRGSSYRRGR